MAFNVGILSKQPLVGNELRSYLGIRESIANQASLAFNAKYAEGLRDLEAGTLYFRDANFNRVPATFSRSTTATRVNAAGLIESVPVNVPRIDYSDGSAKLLMEPSRTNQLQYSVFDSGTFPTGWIQNTLGTYDNTLVTRKGQPCISQNQQTTGRSHIRQNYTFLPSTTYTVKFYISDVNLISGSNVVWTINDGGTFATNKRTTDIVDDYVVATFTTSATAGAGFLQFGIGSATSAQGSCVYGMPQLEEGSYPTSYIPTSGSAVTRNQDGLKVPSGHRPILEAQNYVKYFDFKTISEFNSWSMTSNAPFSTASGQYAQNASRVSQYTTTPYFNITYPDPKLAANGIKILEQKNGTSVRFVENGTLGTINTIAGNSRWDTWYFGLYNLVNTSIPTGFRVASIIEFDTALTDAECIQLTS